VAIVLGLAVAVVYGSADFLGGLATRRSSTFAVVALSQAWGLAVLVAAWPLFGDAHPVPRDLALGAAAGAVGLVGVALLYQALADGSMGVVAPITAVGAAVLPLAWGLGSGERPAPVALAGMVVALVAVALVAGGASAEAGSPAPGAGRHLGLAAGAGAAFGALFILLAATGDDAGLSPLVAARVASLTLLLAAAAILRPPLRPAPGAAAAVAGAGLLEMAANVLFLLAARRGLLSLVAVLASLSPAATSLLARTVLGERLRRVQVGGLGLALVGLVLIASG
jgi:drug/metabolite transporter (DMT)-like permease